MHCPRPLLLRDLNSAILRIERRKIELSLLADGIHEHSDSIEQRDAHSAALDLLADVLPHVTDYTVGQRRARAATYLRKELAGVGCDQKQDALVFSGRRADVPIVGHAQRVVIEILGARALDYDNDELNADLLLQILKHSFETLFRS